MKNLPKIALIIALVVLIAIFVGLYRQWPAKVAAPTAEDTNEEELSSAKGTDFDETDSKSSQDGRHPSGRPRLPTVELNLVEVDDALKGAPTTKPTIRQRAFTTPAGNIVKLELRDDSEILSVEANSQDSLFLVTQGSPRFSSIYNREGELVTGLPKVADVLPDLNPRTQFNWTWGNRNSLVATLGFIREIVPNQYPEGSTEIYEMRLYLYSLETNLLKEMRLPRNIEYDGVLRLDGVPAPGLLKISSAPSDGDYNDANISRLLGVFQIPE